MAPRRRAKAATARAAAIMAVQKKRQVHEGDEEEDDDEEEEEKLATTKSATTTARIHGRKRSHDDDCPADNNHNHQEDKDDDDDEDTDDDCPPPLVGNDEEEDLHGEEDNEEEEDDSENFEGDSEDDEEEEYDHENDDDNVAVRGDANSSSNTMTGEGGCLHCHKNSAPSDIQVRCDECQAYICQHCHWCHEFQANHEIRVCDRCDAFYCRTCDEMDQCDDCGEVVCASCSTLLSCKFCGGGLCEECATACGRCGIVLCSRDAKFAVDCDTCRLSYCLVCLASGSKDPCVRCGHRPSKRMEQLVHLRLKSIYKAFKQSSRNSKFAKGRKDGTNINDESVMDDYDDMEDDDDDDTSDGKSGDPQSLLQAAASAASKHGSGSRANASSSRHSHHSHHHHHSHAHSTTSTNSKRPSAASSSASRDKQAKEMVEKYMAEKEKADAAAAALLAELEEEEQAEKSKKNKKKRKKEREKAKKEEETKKEEPDDQPSSMGDDKDDDTDGEIDLKRVAPPAAKKGSEDSEKDSGKKKKKKKKGQGATSSNNGDGDDNDDDEQDDNAQEEGPTAVSVKDTKAEANIDPVEQQLLDFVNDEDMDGIEQILAAIKGVPGRAALRKNAKKALKRLKQQQEEEEAEAAAAEEAQRIAEEQNARKKEAEHHHNHHSRSSGAGTPATQSETNSSTAGTGPVRPPPPPLPPNELIRVVTTAAQSKPVSGQYYKGVFHIDPRVVGWIIGKGGQRIRDLMEESGAKVWIDQEHLKEHDPRIIYISGNRKNVESASELVQELVAKAPITTGPTGTAPAAAAPGVTAAPSPPVPQSQPAVAKPQSAEHATAAGNEKHQHPVTAAEIVSGNIRSQTPLQEKPTTIANDDALKGPTPLGTLLFSKVEDDTGNSPNNISGVPLVGGLPSGHPDPAGIENYNEHEMTCEACFVPLLIGRRGWTIKHIQDSSGARVDIDQTVTPRKIRISGKDENVQNAVRMVRDVLSYPHAQLLGAGEAGEERAHRDVHQALGVDLVAATASSLERLQVGESTGATLSNTTTVEASNQILVSGLQSPAIVSTQQSERVHTPPPSSTINIGDAKSTISASSSLSSTPEPSMASSKGHFSAAGLSGSLLPPDFGGGVNYSQQQPSLPNSNLFGQHNNFGNNHGMMPPQHNAPPLFPGGGMPVPNLPPVSPRYDMQSGMHRGFSQPPPHAHQQHLPQHLQQRQQFGGPSMQHPANLRSISGPGGLPHPNAHFQARPEQHVMHHSQSLQFPTGMPGQQSGMHPHHQSAFHQKQSQHNSAPDLAMTGMSPNPALGVGSRGMQQGQQGTFSPPGMWNDLGAESPNTGQLQRPSQADSYQRNPMPMHRGIEQSTDLRLNAPIELGSDFIGLQGSELDSGVEAGFRKAPNPLGTPGRDDSRMVDSLFGPSDGGVVEEKNLLPGFQGLSLGEGLSTDPWAGSASSQKWDGGDAPKSSSALFAAIQPTLDAKDAHHPSRSRFGFNDSQGRPS